MKRLLALLLALAMLTALAACGDQPDSAPIDGDNPLAIESVPPEEDASDADYVEEAPPANTLDPACPIPADTGTLTLTPQTFEDANLTLNLPEGVTAWEEERTENFAYIYVTDDEGKWKLRFMPFIQGANTIHNISSTLIYDGNPIKTDWSQDVPTTLAGFPTRVWANNIRPGWLYPSNEQDTPAVDMFLDYGETLAGPWYGMYIRLEAQDPTEDTNIYELLYLRHVRAILNNFEVIATPDGQTLSAGGITLTFPARWDVRTGENGFVTSFHSEALSGGVNFGTAGGSSPEELRSYWEGESFTKSYAGKEYQCVVVQTGGSDENDPPSYAMRMYSDFSDKRVLSLYLSIRGYDAGDYKGFLDGELFTTVMESMVIDPAGYHEPGTASLDGFDTKRGILTGYSGSDAQVEIPAIIGDYDVTVIGDRVFAGNEAITSVTIPEGVTVIYPSAFEGCPNLETVVLPETLLEIDANAFRDCPKLRDVKLPAGVTYVGYRAFDGSGAGSFQGSGAIYGVGCFDGSGFETISIPVGGDVSAEQIFASCAATEIHLPEDLTVLGQSAFSGTKNLTHLELPATLRELGPYCFSNFSGGLSLTLPEGIEVIPESCFNSTTLDVLILPKSVKKIERSATYAAAYIVLQNPAVELEESAINCDFLYITDAPNFWFPDYTAIWANRVYLDGLYDPGQIQGNLAEQVIQNQVYLPMDATMAESDALDQYLASIGMEEIAWIGTGLDFLPEETVSYTRKDNALTGAPEGSALLTVPEYVKVYEDPFWTSYEIWTVADGAFAGSGAAAAYLRGDLDGIGSRIFEGCSQLKDLWFSSVIAYYATVEGWCPADAFAGLPQGITVHLPASLNDEEQAAVKAFLQKSGLPDSAVFTSYSLR